MSKDSPIMSEADSALLEVIKKKYNCTYFETDDVLHDVCRLVHMVEDMAMQASHDRHDRDKFMQLSAVYGARIVELEGMVVAASDRRVDAMFELRKLQRKKSIWNRLRDMWL